jgi:ligand-binding sensor domain-containing protein
MRSTFRYVWSLVTLLLLMALVAVVRLAWVNNPAGSTQTIARRTPTPTARVTASPPPTQTITASVEGPPTATVTLAPTPTVALGNVQRIATGGFAFQPPAAFAVEVAGTLVTMTVEGAPGSLLLAASPAVARAGDTPDEQLSYYGEQYTGADDLVLDDLVTITVDSQLGWMADLVGEIDGAPHQGRIVLVQPQAEQAVVLIGQAPASDWPDLAASFDATLGSVRFFAPTGSPVAAVPIELRPTSTPTATRAVAVADTPSPRATRQRSATGWRSYTNANFANAVTAALNTVWVATDGGIIAWNKNNGRATKYTTLDGLAANRNTAVVNCPLRGLGVVFGSEVGLQIYDTGADSWKTLNSSNSNMSFDDVSALHCDVENRFLIIGYQQHGLDIFDANQGVWRSVGQNEGLQNNLVEAVGVVGDREELWVSSGLGISVINADGTTEFYDEANSALETNQIHRIAVDSAGVVWLGAQDALYRIEDDEWTIYDQREVLASDFPSGALVGLAVAEDGTLWLGSTAGEICHFDPVRVQCREFFHAEPGMVAGELTSLTIGADGAIYYTTAGGGVSMYAGGRWRAFAVPDELLLGNEIHSLAQTTDGLVWIATERGIQALHPITETVVRQFTRNDSELLSATSEVLHAAPEGGLWFGAVGVSYFNGLGWQSYTTVEGLAGSLVQAIATDGQGRTWFGTESGLSIWNGSTFFNLTRDNGLPSDNIRTLVVDGPIMWISATDGGLLRFERNQLQVFTEENSALPSNSITALARLDDGVLLLGHSQGLARFEDGEVTSIPALDGYPVTAIAIAPDGVIWVGTGDAGLFYFDGEDWTQPPGQVQPPSPQITALLIDAEGSVWVGAQSGGIIRFEP